MIYFTKVDDDTILFQFHPKELPDSVGISYRTKTNYIEYNGGVMTNQIIGIFQEPVEFEGCFFGSYRINGSNLSAKERAEKLKSLMGIPLKCVFAVPDGNSPAFSPIEGKKEGNFKFKGDKMICIIEQFEIKVINHSEVDYSIKLTPHMNQKKITPTQVQIQEIKIIPDNIVESKKNIAEASKKAKDGKLKEVGPTHASSDDSNDNRPTSMTGRALANPLVTQGRTPQQFVGGASPGGRNIQKGGNVYINGKALGAQKGLTTPRRK
jgi:hypothetical protein